MKDGLVSYRRTLARERATLATVSKVPRGNRGVHYGNQPRQNSFQLHRNYQMTMTHVISKDVQPTIIRVRFLLQAVPDVMFRNEMTRHRM
jgi:hypothetical protein